MYQKEATQENLQTDKILYYVFVEEVLKQLIQQDNENINMHFLYAHLSSERLQNRIKAVNEIFLVTDSKPSLQAEFSCYRAVKLVQLAMIDNEIQFNEINDFDVMRFVKFETLFA